MTRARVWPRAEGAERKADIKKFPRLNENDLVMTLKVSRTGRGEGEDSRWVGQERRQSSWGNVGAVQVGVHLLDGRSLVYGHHHSHGAIRHPGKARVQAGWGWGGVVAQWAGT